MTKEKADPARVKILIGITLSSSMSVFGKGFMAFLKQHGCDVYLCARKDMMFDVIEDEGFTFIEMPFQRKFNPLNDIQLFCRFVKIFKKVKPDVVDFMTLKPRAVGALASKFTGIPLIIGHIWGYFGDCNYDAFRKKVLFMTNKIGNHLSDRVVAICAEIKVAEEQAKRTPRDRTIVYGQGSAFGIDTEEIKLTDERIQRGRQLRSEWGVEQNIVFGSVMRINIEKGITELVDAFVKLYEKNPKYRLLLAGRHDIRNKPPERTLRLIEEHPGIKFAGFVDDIRDFYAAIDIYVLPTYREGFCNSNLEASCMSKPIISTDIIGVNNSSVIDGVTGLIVPVKDTDKLAEKMELLANDSELREKLGRQGRQRVEKYFDKKLVWHYHLKDICRLLQEKGITPPVDPELIESASCPLCQHISQ